MAICYLTKGVYCMLTGVYWNYMAGNSGEKSAVVLSSRLDPTDTKQYTLAAGDFFTAFYGRTGGEEGGGGHCWHYN